MAPAVPCKTSKNSQHGATRGKSNEIKTKLACILEADESTRLRMGEIFTESSRRPYCRKGGQFTATLQFGTQFFPMPRAMKIPAAKAVEKEWKN